MSIPDRSITAICAAFDDSRRSWSDSLGLSYLLAVAHECGVLRDVGTLHVLDDEHDVFAVSVEVSSDLYVHGELTQWSEVRPEAEMDDGQAVRHVLRRLDEVAARVRAQFLSEVATIVSTALLPGAASDKS